MTNMTNASSSNIRQPRKQRISITAIQFVSSESSDGFKGHLGQSSCIMNSSSANSSCIWIGALPRITLEHIELGNCLSTRTSDTIWINPPEDGRRNRGSKAGIRKKRGKERVTLWSVFTPILKEKKVDCFFSVFYLPLPRSLCWNVIDSLFSSKTQMWSNTKKSTWVDEGAIQCSFAEIRESARTGVCSYIQSECFYMHVTI